MINLLRKIGKKPLCNGRKECAPQILGYSFILCWRCTALIGTIMTCCLLSYFVFGSIYSNADIYLNIFGCILVLPTLFDGIRQYFFDVESNNRRRIVFGIISGVGLWIITPKTYDILKYIVNLINI